MAIARTERALWEAAIASALATVEALTALEYLARDFDQGLPGERLALATRARDLEHEIRSALSEVL